MTPIRKSAITLMPGHTYEEFVLRYYDTRFTYEDICAALKMKLNKAREICDGVYMLPLSAIGQFKGEPPKMPPWGDRLTAPPTQSKLEIVPWPNWTK